MLLILGAGERGEQSTALLGSECKGRHFSAIRRTLSLLCPTHTTVEALELPTWDYAGKGAGLQWWCTKSWRQGSRDGTFHSTHTIISWPALVANTSSRSDHLISPAFLLWIRDRNNYSILLGHWGSILWGAPNAIWQSFSMSNTRQQTTTIYPTRLVSKLKFIATLDDLATWGETELRLQEE